MRLAQNRSRVCTERNDDVIELVASLDKFVPEIVGRTSTFPKISSVSSLGSVRDDSNAV